MGGSTLALRSTLPHTPHIHPKSLASSGRRISLPARQRQDLQKLRRCLKGRSEGISAGGWDGKLRRDSVGTRNLPGLQRSRLGGRGGLRSGGDGGEDPLRRACRRAAGACGRFASLLLLPLPPPASFVVCRLPSAGRAARIPEAGEAAVTSSTASFKGRRTRSRPFCSAASLPGAQQRLAGAPVVAFFPRFM